MYRVLLSREAERFYNRCGKAEALERNPRSGNNVKPLKGRFAGSYRYRVGDCRVVYTIDDREVIVFVITIARRGDVYE